MNRLLILLFTFLSTQCYSQTEVLLEGAKYLEDINFSPSNKLIYGLRWATDTSYIFVWNEFGKIHNKITVPIKGHTYRVGSIDSTHFYVLNRNGIYGECLFLDTSGSILNRKILFHDRGFVNLVAKHDNSYLFCASTDSNSIKIFDKKLNQIDEFKLQNQNDFITKIEISPDDKFILVTSKSRFANFGNYNLSLFSVEGKLIKEFEDYYTSAVFNSDGTKIIGSKTNGGIHNIDFNGNSIEVFPVSPKERIQQLGKGRYIAASNGSIFYLYDTKGTVVYERQRISYAKRWVISLDENYFLLSTQGKDGYDNGYILLNNPLSIKLDEIELFNSIVNGKDAFLFLDKFPIPQKTKNCKINDYYAGETKNGLANGYGKSILKRRLYIGHFVNGLYSGKGVLYNTDGTLYYEGDFLNGKLEGEAKVYYYEALSEELNGFYYTGKVKNGIPYGLGILTNPSPKGFGNAPVEIFYKGNWINGKKNGQFEVKTYYVGVGAVYKDHTRFYKDDIEYSYKEYKKVSMSPDEKNKELLLNKTKSWSFTVDRKNENTGTRVYYLSLYRGDEIVEEVKINVFFGSSTRLTINLEVEGLLSSKDDGEIFAYADESTDEAIKRLLKIYIKDNYTGSKLFSF